jgi:ribosome-associated protein
VNFQLKDEYIELCKLLKVANLVMSGGEGKEVVAQGLVTVDGQLETRKRCKIRAGQTIEFENQTIQVFSHSQITQMSIDKKIP